MKRVEVLGVRVEMPSNQPIVLLREVEGDRRVRFRRIAYPFETTSKKIHAIPDLDNFLGDRLGQGR